MGPFGWGLVGGATIGLAAATIAGLLLYRRIWRTELRARQAERLAELGTLTGGLAHEIKNPLSTIQLNLQLLQEDITTENPAYSRVINRLKICERETGRLREILDDFLRYAGKIELQRTKVELNRMCEDLVDFFLPQAQLGRVQLRLKRAPADVSIMADERLLKQAVLNLMLNGVQAMPSGGELILAVSDGADEAMGEIIDTGSGID